MKRTSCLFVMLFLFTSVADAEVVNRVAAVVNNEVITEHELSAAIASSQKVNAAKTDSSARQEVLEKLIDEKLFIQLMTKSRIEVSDDDLARAIANILQKNRMSIDQLKAELASKGISYEDYKKKIENDIRRIKFINQVVGPQVKITDQDLRDHYQRNQTRFRGSISAHIAEIAMPLDGVASQEDFNRMRDVAMGIVTRARHGTSFESLAKQHSKGPNAENGGDLGMVELKNLPRDVADLVRGLKPSEVGGPILAGNAIIIVKLISLPELSAGDFEKLRDEIYSTLYDQKIEETMNNYLARERQRAFVETR